MKSRQNLFNLTLLFLVAALTGCATTSSLFVPPAPSPIHSLPRPISSKLRIPIVVALPSLKDLEKHISDSLKEDAQSVNQELTKKFGSKVWWDPLAWEFKGNQMTAKMHLHYSGQKITQNENSESVTQEIEKELQTKISSSVQWSKDWHLEAPDFKDNTLEAEAKTDAKKGEKLLRKGTDKFNESLKKATSIEGKFKEVWDEIQEPIKISDGVWLQVFPNRISVGDCKLIPDPKNPRVETVFELYAVPRVVFGDKPKIAKKEKLPPLSDYIPGGEGFHIVTNIKLKFDEVNKLLTAPKTGIVNMALPGGEDYNVRLTSVRVWGSGEKIVVEAGVDYAPLVNLNGKPAHMTVYLLGTPAYNQKTQVISFPDMDFDIKSSDFLVQMVEFFDGDGMRKILREKAVVPVGQKMTELRKELDHMLNRQLAPHVMLKMDIQSLKMQEAFVSDKGLEGRVAIDGEAAVNLVW